MRCDETSKIVQRASDILGKNPDGNRSIKARDSGAAHIDCLNLSNDEDTRAVAPLIEVLCSKPVKYAFDHYDKHNQTAVKEQQQYKRVRFLLVAPLSMALALGLLLLIVPQGAVSLWLTAYCNQSNEFTRQLCKLEPETIAWLGPLLLVNVLLALTPVLALFLRPRRHHDKWKMARGTAESMRRELFRRIFRQPAQASDTDVPLELLKLEHFRRWQIELQIEYLRSRGQEQLRATRIADWTQISVLVLLTLWVLGSLLLNFAGTTEQGPVTWSLFRWLVPYWHDASAVLLNYESAGIDRKLFAGGVFLGLMAAAMTFYVTIDGSVRNAARYEQQRQNFEKLNADLDQVRKIAGGANLNEDTKKKANAEVEKFMDRVHSIMALELADWVRLHDLEQGREEESRLASTSALV